VKLCGWPWYDGAFHIVSFVGEQSEGEIVVQIPKAHASNHSLLGFSSRYRGQQQIRSEVWQKSSVRAAKAHGRKRRMLCNQNTMTECFYSMMLRNQGNWMLSWNNVFT
jgi:hypothetical protein